MDKLRNIISRFRKPEHALIKVNTENSSLKGPEDIPSNIILPNNDITNQNNILQRSDDKKASVTQEINIPQSNDIKEFSINETNACKDTTIVKLLKKVETKPCQNMNQNVCEANKVKNNKNDEKIASELLSQQLKNTNLSIKTKAELTDSQFMNIDRHENKIGDNIQLIQNETNNRQASVVIFPDLPKVAEATNSKLPNNTNVTLIRNESNENRNSNPVDVLNSNDSLNIQHDNDKTTKCLQEFDKVLSEVQGNNNLDGVEGLSLEGIDDIIFNNEGLKNDDDILNIDDINDDDLLNIDDIFDDDEDLDMDSTYNFQEIKNTTSSIDKYDFLAIRHTLQVVMTGRSERKATKSETEDCFDVISISSGDDTSTIVGNEFGVIKENEFLLLENNAGDKSFAETMTYEGTKSIPKPEGFKKLKKSEEFQMPDNTKSSEPIIIGASNSDHNLRTKSSVANNFKETNSTKDTTSLEETKSFKDANSSEAIKSTNDATSLEETENFKDAHSSEAIKSTKDATSLEQTKSFDDATNLEAIKSTNDAINLEQTKSFDDAESSEAIKSTKDATSLKQTKSFDYAESSEAIKSTNDATNLEQTKSVVDAKRKSSRLKEAKSGEEPTKSKRTKNFVETKSPEEAKTSNFLDTISISSDEHLETISIQSDKIESDDCGYHTSDFECISEEEANKVGLVSKFDLARPFKAKVDPNSEATMQNDPYGPGPSRNSGKYSHRAEEKETTGENYVMPTERQTVNMFRDMPAIPTSEIHFLENKSLHARVPMMVQYEGIGFDMSLAMHQDSEDEEYRDEAQENMKILLKMYPAENDTRKRTKRRRR